MRPPSSPHSWLQRAETIAEFVAAPVGKYVASSSFLYFQSTNNVTGFALWGCPTAADMRALHRAMNLHSAHGAGPHESLIDMVGLVSVDAASFDVFAEGLAARYGDMARAFSRQAVLRPTGLVGAMVAGFFDLLPPPYEAEVFADQERALDWLGTSEPIASSLRQLVDTERGFDPLLDRLQCLLDSTRGDQLRLNAAARLLGTSERTLQRRLQEASTSFQCEIQRAQIRLAKQLMRDSSLSLSAIAVEVGCASQSHFSAMFRRSTRVTPSQWRAHQATPAREVRPADAARNAAR
jgi:AraC-like DNA-binding protein